MKIQSEVPFGQRLYGWLCLNQLHLDEIVQHDQIEQGYLAWESVRKTLNPFFYEGTGFEGYLVGRCASPEAALESILAINQHILDSIAMLYRFQYSFRSKLMKTLLRETSDSASIHTWSGHLGAELGRLRAQILSDTAAQAFQKQTYRIIRTLPPMIYRESEHDVLQTYNVGSVAHPPPGKIYVALPMLKPSQQDAWLVAQNIGEFGHPLVRKFLDRPN